MNTTWRLIKTVGTYREAEAIMNSRPVGTTRITGYIRDDNTREYRVDAKVVIR